MKLCNRCGIEKPVDEFYRHPHTADGLLNQCKVCKRKSAADHRAANLEKIRHYDRNRPNHYERLAKGYARRKALGLRSPKETDPLKYRARNILNAAVRDGKIEKPESCPRCGRSGRIHGHHHDYEKPLEVEWLCSRCHGLDHRRYQNTNQEDQTETWSFQP